MFVSNVRSVPAHLSCIGETATPGRFHTTAALGVSEKADFIGRWHLSEGCAGGYSGEGQFTCVLHEVMNYSPVV